MTDTEHLSTDNELLMQFARRKDERAFRQLVERHTAMVMRVCRSTSRNEQDAEDAFQATFLILAGRASKLLRISSVGGWLHRVAYRTALRTRARRRRLRETAIVDEPELGRDSTLEQVQERDLQRVVHEELQRLSQSYRNAIVLCDIEGKSRAQAAAQLECTEQALKGTLARGRRQLRLRMLRRGAVLSWGLALINQAVAASPERSPAAIESLVAACVQQFEGVETVGCSASVRSLVQEGATLMTWSTMATPAGVITAAVLLLSVPLVLLGQISVEDRHGADTVVLAAGEETAEADGSVETVAEVQPTVESPTEPESANGLDNTRRLEDELVETLESLVEVSTELYRGGLTEIEDVVRFRNLLHEAQLQLARGSQERTAVHQQTIADLQSLEKNTEEMREAGKRSVTNYLEVKAARIEAELALARETARNAIPNPQLAPAPIQTIRPGDILEINAEGAPNSHPLKGFFLVEPTGKVALGATYGRVEVAGLSLEDAEVEVQKALAAVLHGTVLVEVTSGEWKQPPGTGMMQGLIDEMRQLRREISKLRRPY